MSNSINKFNGLSETSVEFCMQVNENTFLDIKQILIHGDKAELRQKMFRTEFILYVFVMNMDKYNKFELSKEFVEFTLGQTRASRAYLFKIIKKMCEVNMLEKLKRGWYRVKCVDDAEIARDNKLIN